MARDPVTPLTASAEIHSIVAELPASMLLHAALCSLRIVWERPAAPGDRNAVVLAAGACIRLLNEHERFQ